MKLNLTNLEVNLIVATLDKLDNTGLLDPKVSIIATMIKDKIKRNQEREYKHKVHAAHMGIH